MLMINFGTNHPKKSYTFTKNSANSENVEQNAKILFLTCMDQQIYYSSMLIVNSLSLRINSHNAYSKSLLVKTMTCALGVHIKVVFTFHVC